MEDIEGVAEGVRAAGVGRLFETCDDIVALHPANQQMYVCGARSLGMNARRQAGSLHNEKDATVQALRVPGWIRDCPLMTELLHMALAREALPK